MDYRHNMMTLPGEIAGPLSEKCGRHPLPAQLPANHTDEIVDAFALSTYQATTSSSVTHVSFAEANFQRQARRNSAPEESCERRLPGDSPRRRVVSCDEAPERFSRGLSIPGLYVGQVSRILGSDLTPTKTNVHPNMFVGPMAELYPDGLISRPERISKEEWEEAMGLNARWSHRAEDSGG